MYDVVIIRYGEIFLKSDYVRKRFEDILVENIKCVMRKRSIEGNLYRKRLRLYMETGDALAACEHLGGVFGLTSVSPATKTSANVEDITGSAITLAGDILSEGDSFAVRVKRSGRHPFKSVELEALIGERILREFNVRVDLKNPEKTIHIEVRDDEAFVFDRKIPCPGGLPYGSQGRLVALLSGGIDSPVASWLMMRRGCVLSFLHFGPREDVVDIVEKLESYACRDMRLYCVPYDDVLSKIAKHAGKYTCVVCKRFMYRVAEGLSAIEGAQGIVTGDNVGQVASQTLENLSSINCVDIPVYRPAIGMDKVDIVGIARDIGTYELMKNKGCNYVPKKPATRSSMDSIAEIEEKAGVAGLVDAVLDDLKTGAK